MMIRTDVAELLRAGHSNRAIARQLGVCTKDVAAARAVLGLPRAKSGRTAAASPEDLFWQRTEPTSDGHRRWTGSRANNDGTPVLRHGGRAYTAYRIAYRIANGREPEGYAQPSCGHDGCVQPGHHTDRADRQREQRLNDLYAAIFGGAP